MQLTKLKISLDFLSNFSFSSIFKHPHIISFFTNNYNKLYPNILQFLNLYCPLICQIKLLSLLLCLILCKIKSKRRYKNDSRSDQSNKAIKIPILGTVIAGIPISAIEEIIGWEEISPKLASQGDYFALKIKGDSMSPTMDAGDVVIVRKQQDVNSGDIAIVCVNGDEATCKKIIKHKDGISLVSLNLKYEPMYYDKNDIADKPIHIIGKVIELRRRF
ncbi:LexA family protein [Candidatus Arthromitus sp. SFB-mouse-NL]|uniref:LexA family protein n=1 Tax=Candidatus Arthromitus sp. SFB-mouse-NL TaxID=1508644 RepID=UPI0035107A6A